MFCLPRARGLKFLFGRVQDKSPRSKVESLGLWEVVDLLLDTGLFAICCSRRCQELQTSLRPHANHQLSRLLNGDVSRDLHDILCGLRLACSTFTTDQDLLDPNTFQALVVISRICHRARFSQVGDGVWQAVQAVHDIHLRALSCGQ
eukprot:1173238-Amphidinium_carterae.3